MADFIALFEIISSMTFESSYMIALAIQCKSYGLMLYKGAQ